MLMSSGNAFYRKVVIVNVRDGFSAKFVGGKSWSCLRGRLAKVLLCRISESHPSRFTALRLGPVGCSWLGYRENFSSAFLEHLPANRSCWRSNKNLSTTLARI